MSAKDFSSRTKARARAVDVLYEARAKGLDDAPGIFSLAGDRQEISTAQTPIPPYAVTILEGVAQHIEQIDKVLTTYSKGWALDRMPAVDLAILRMGTWEILYGDSIPSISVITEAMKIARMKSTDNSPRFINGLLAQIGDFKEAILGGDIAKASALDQPEDVPEADFNFTDTQLSGLDGQTLVELDKNNEPVEHDGRSVLEQINLDNLN